ncbi:MAG: hypothetical protein DIU71_10285 [Proteobacteria bacterium]|nr:MAG: hypothetical protein DIU71_10285 [Pseudomonadota bacterium]
MMYRPHAFRAGAALLTIAIATTACSPRDQESSQPPEAMSSTSCDRACLSGLLTDYLAALEAGDVSGLRLADEVRFTEDQQTRTLGVEGIWASDVELMSYRLDMIDVREGVAASLVKVRENGVPVLMALRLLTAEGRISGVESMVVRTEEEGMIYAVDAVQTPSEAMTHAPPPAQRNTREEMIEIASRYPRGLQVGSFVTSDVPFAPDAYRFENGQLMAGPGCTFLPGCEHIKTQRIPTLSGLVYRVAAVDEEQGIVLLRMDFGPGSVFERPGRPQGQSVSVFEAFKVYGGQVHAVEAFMELKPAEQSLGWEFAETSVG